MAGGLFLAICLFILSQASSSSRWILIPVALVFWLAFWFINRWEKKRRTVELIYEFEEGSDSDFKKVIEAFNAIQSCSKVWLIGSSYSIGNQIEKKRNAGADNLVQRKAVELGAGVPPWTESNIDIPTMSAQAQTLYFMPDGIFVYDKSGVGVVNYSDLNIECGETNFIEDESVPRDSKVLYHTWKHPNKKGGPDKRFKDNYEIPVCGYGELWLKSESGLFYYLMLSKAEAGQEFRAAMSGVVGGA
jgi:hypothetical protein